MRRKASLWHSVREDGRARPAAAHGAATPQRCRPSPAADTHAVRSDGRGTWATFRRRARFPRASRAAIGATQPRHVRDRYFGQVGRVEPPQTVRSARVTLDRPGRVLGAQVFEPEAMSAGLVRLGGQALPGPPARLQGSQAARSGTPALRAPRSTSDRPAARRRSGAPSRWPTSPAPGRRGAPNRGRGSPPRPWPSPPMMWSARASISCAAGSSTSPRNHAAKHVVINDVDLAVHHGSILHSLPHKRHRSGSDPRELRLRACSPAVVRGPRTRLASGSLRARHLQIGIFGCRRRHADVPSEPRDEIPGEGRRPGHPPFPLRWPKQPSQAAPHRSCLRTSSKRQHRLSVRYRNARGQAFSSRARNGSSGNSVPDARAAAAGLPRAGLRRSS